MDQKIIYCNCGGGIIDENIKKKTLDLITGLAIEKVKLEDLCGLCATQKEDIKNLLSTSSNTLIVACHPRAVKLLLNYAGVHSLDKLSFIDLCASDGFSTLENLDKYENVPENSNPITEIKTNTDWPAWYPVLDYSRCTACGQCADFCLFGVYEKRDGIVEVVNPSGCKNNCPACARICPYVAIVFPKYLQGGAIGGSDSFDEVLEQNRQLEDMNQLLGGDIYQALGQRKAKRQSIIKDEALKRAMEERNMALKENKK